MSTRALALAGKYGIEIVLDDAFISFRYARNLADGLGLVFNPGERVEGYTNFLWTVLLAAGNRLGLDPVPMSIVLSFLASIGSLLVLGLFARAQLPRDRYAVLLVGTGLLAFAANGAVARYVLAGMETPLFALFVLLGFYVLLQQRRPLAAGAVFCLAALTRPEGLLYGALGAVGLLALERKAPVRRRLASAGRLAAGLAAGYAPYFAWRWSYYGELLPNTFYVKSGQLSAQLLERGWDHLITMASQIQIWIPCGLGLLALAWRRHRRFAAWAGGVVLATAGYVVLVGGDFLFFFGPRFLLPVLPLALVVAVAALDGLARWQRLGPPASRRLSAAGATLLVLATLGLSWPARHGQDMATVALFGRGWEEIGRWLDGHTAEEAVIGVGAIGRIGFYADRRILDMLGLTDRHIAHLEVPLGGGVPGHEKYDTGYVLRRKPDYIVFPRIDPAGRPFLAQWNVHGETVQREYSLIALGKTSLAPGPWVLETEAFDQGLWNRGYQAAIYRRRVAAAADGGTEPSRDPVRPTL